MKTIYFTENIQASPAKVHEVMLDQEHYQEWTKPFSPTSNFSGSWEEGSKIFFTSQYEDGALGGLVSRIETNIPGDIVIIRHMGIVSKEGELYDGPMVDAWRNALEVYRFKAVDDGTQITCSVEIGDEEEAGMFDESWPAALRKLKEICEN
ncbi:SRPBCC family protein [Sphingobacterium lactis]|uniref:Activator of Hsp90 ATPase homolog 1-like protein n=1 Tax=Sphingobacterium lactis TaxID=797291 RepID=A0A1H5UKC0_9SPHI|nr:SRPBCC domain-containing protein [Sphingobacterium lactis]SEF75446.1 Activator of Hsp90 ATPase homolog 1-like protein [Sphingobacterium lactis]